MRQTLNSTLVAAAYLVLMITTLAADADAPPSCTRVAIVQMSIRPALTENRDRIVAGIEQAAKRGARVAVFPERALSGGGEDRQELVDAALDRIRSAARERSVYVVMGVHSWIPSVKKTANWMLVIAPDGRDVFRYEKLYDIHRAKITRGKRHSRCRAGG